MADYTIRVEADTRDSQDKIDRLDRRLNEVERPRKIEINLPSLGDAVNGVKTLGDALKTTFNVARSIPGNPISDLASLGDIAAAGARKVADSVALIGKATPFNILNTSFNVASESSLTLSKNVASLGYTIFGITQSVNILKSAFGGFFDETIGREIKLQETLLRTKTTLVSTADVAVNGKRITDPFEAIVKLEGPINKTVDNIRTRSLEIAGTTSDAIIQTFGVVAGQIGAFGGTLKDAEDLSISFAGALGTLGLSDPMWATQEIRSILTGNIDQNSILARSLGLTNEEVAKAKKSADGLVVYLQKRLEAFTAGQSIAAKGFAGIVFNIQEVQQELSRVFGRPFLQPLLDGLTKVYERLQLVTMSLKKAKDGSPIPGPAMNIADAAGRAGSAVVSGVAGAALQAPSLARFSQRAQYEGMEKLAELSAQAFLKVQEAVDSIRPKITALAEEAIKAGKAIIQGLGALALGFAQFKFENFKYQLQGFIGLAELLNNTLIPAFSNLLKLYGQLLSMDNIQFLAQFTGQWQALEKVGILPAARAVVTFWSTGKLLLDVFRAVPKVFAAIASAADTALNFVSGAIARVSAVVVSLGVGALEWIALIGKAMLSLGSLISVAVGKALINLAEFLVATQPALVELNMFVLNLGKAFLSIEVPIKKAQIAITQFAVKASEKLAELELQTEKVRAKFNQIGAGIQGLAGAGVKGIGSMIAGIAKFFAGMLVLQIVITGILDEITRSNEQQKNLSDKTRAELAVRRLSTAYKDLGENASLAARKAKELEESIVSSRLSDTTNKIEELSNKIRGYQDVAAGKKNSFTDRLFQAFDPKLIKFSGDPALDAALRPGEKRITNYLLGDMFVDSEGKQISAATLAARVEVKRLEDERRKLAQEAQNLLKVQQKAEDDKKSQENVQILAKERKDLEKAISDYRKELNKEVTDSEFNFRQEKLQIEQTAREAQRAADAASLSRTLDRNLEGLSGVRRQIGEILNTYQKNLFNAQTESQRRQFDLARQKEKMEKNLSDYKLKLEEQIVKLRQRSNDYSAKMTKWEGEEREKTARRVLEYAMRAGVALAGRITLLPEDREEFMKQAAKRDVSAQRVLAYGMSGVNKDLLPALAGGDMGMLIDQIMGSVADRSKALFNSEATSDAEFVSVLNNNTKNRYGQSRGGAYNFSQAGTLLNSDYFKKLTPAPPPKLQGIGDIEALNRDAIDKYNRSQNAIEAANARLFALQDNIASTEALNATLDQINSVFKAGTESQEELTAKNAELSGQIKLLRESKALSVNPLDTQNDTIIQTLTSVATRLANTSLNGTRLKNDETKNKFVDIVLDVFNKNISKIKSGVNTGEFILNSYKDELKATKDPLRKLAIQAVLSATEQVLENSSPAKRALVTRNTALTQEKSITEEIKKLTSTFQEESQTLIAKVREALLPEDSVARRLFTANNLIEQRRRSPELETALQDSGFREAFTRWGDLVRLSATKLGELDKAIEAFSIKLALIKDVAATFTDGLKASFKNILNGQVKGFEEMMNALRDKLTNTLADWAFKPIQQSIENELRRWFNVPNEAQKLADLQKKYTEEFQTAVKKFDEAVRTFRGESPTPEAPNAPATPGTPPSPGSPTSPDSPAPAPEQEAGAIAGNVNTTAAAVKNLGEQAKAAPPNINKATEGLQNFLGGMATVAAGIAGIVSGIQQLGDKKGGAAGTLMGLSNIFIGLGSTLIGGGKLFRAAGGPVAANSPYIVGERGPEWFVPSRAGTVLPNGVGPGGGVNSVVNVNISDSGARTDNNQASQLGRMIDSAVVNIINRERRPGGLLTAR